jgi:monoamine oxidase
LISDGYFKPTNMKKSSRTQFFATLRKAFHLALQAEKQQTEAAEVIGQAQEASLSRRRFLENTGKAMIGGVLAPNLLLGANRPLIRPFMGAAVPRIAIVGGGMAGLNALHILKKNNLDATVYEATGRTGGRMFTVQEAMGKGTWTEFGGEFIDTDHKDMWDLAKELNIEFIDYGQASETALTKEAFFFEGQHHSMEEVVTEFRTFAPRIQADAEKLNNSELSYEATDPYVKKLDKMSLCKYLKKIGARGWVKRFIEVAYESEYGLSPKVQSSINLIFLISPDTSSGELALFGASDERYKVPGGNQRIPDELAKKYTANIEINRPLESLRQEGNSYKLHFGGMANDVIADYVILTLPFTKLRSIDFPVDMPPVKRKCIDKLGYGTNSKLMLGMKSHFWRKQGFTGLMYSDNGIPNGWDNAQLQNADDGPAGLSILFGGRSGVKLGKGTPNDQKNKYLPLWEQVFKGATEQFNGQVARMHWPSYPYNLGSYVCPTRGQYTSISGAEQMPIGNILFAGEHCGGDFAGFMNGAAKSGREAAEEILQRLS